MKKLIWILMLVSVASFATIKIDVDQLRSPDHTKVWTPPSATTTLIGDDTSNALTNKTLDKLVSTSEQVNAVATGSNAIVTTPTSLVTQLTNVSLVSIDGITAPADNQIFVLKNKTGATITLNNQTGVNTTYRIITGTAANLTLADGASVILAYSTTDSRWQVVGGSGSGGGLSAWVISHAYLAGDIAIESNKIYNCLTPHTSGTFATDLAGGNWVELSAMTGVDLTSNQTVAGTKTFSSTIAGSITGNAATVTTNANLTGPITSSGNTTSVASQTGTGSTFVMSAAPTITGHPVIEGVTSTGATGTGKFVFDTSPTLVTPVLGVATATSINGTSIPSSATLATTALNLGNFGATTSAQLAGVISDETGSGALVFGTAPQFTTSVAIGGSPNANAVLDVQSTTKAFMPPRMTTTQKLAIASPAAGMVVYDSTLNAQSTYDGTNWQTGLGTITVDTDWTSGGVNVIGGTTTAPTKATTPVTDETWYRRNGPDLEVRFAYRQTSSTGTAAGSGDYLFTIPSSSGCVIDTAKVKANSTIVAQGITMNYFLDSTVGSGSVDDGNNQQGLVGVSVYDSTRVRLSGVMNTGGTGAYHFTLGSGAEQITHSANMAYRAAYKVPCVGWSSNNSTLSAASLNYDWTNYTPASIGAGFGTVTLTNICKHRRVGGDLEMSCSFTVGTIGNASANMTIPLPNSLAIDTSKIILQNANNAAGDMLGRYDQGATSNTHGNVVAAPATSTTQVYLTSITGGTNALIPGNATGNIASSQVTSVTFKVPISGWSNISQVVANISGYAQAPGVAGTATPNLEHLVANFGTTNASTVCSASPCSYLDQIGNGITSITRSSAGNYSINTAKTYSKLKCYVQAQSATTLYEAYVASCANCSTTTFQTGLSTSTVDTMGAIFCTGMY